MRNTKQRKVVIMANRNKVSVDNVYIYIINQQCTAAACAKHFSVSTQTIRNKIDRMTEKQKEDIKSIELKIKEQAVKYYKRNVSIDGVYGFIMDHQCDIVTCAEHFDVCVQTIRNRISNMTEEQKTNIKTIKQFEKPEIRHTKQPRIVSKEDVFEYMSATHCTYRACAEHFNVSRQTILNRVKEMTEEQQKLVNRRSSK